MNNDYLKYRVWDIENKQYIQDDADYCDLKPDGTIEIGIYSDGESYPNCFWEDEKVIVERCTGEKDKTSTLIYEGDILEFAHGKKGTVKWINSLSAFYADIDGDLYQLFLTCEIVGNVHNAEE